MHQKPQAPDLAWKQIAWNGISMTVPQSWEVEKIGNQYLFLEENTRPVMELKWRQIKGKFSHSKQLKRLAGLYNKGLTQKINACPLPRGWRQALSDFDASGFNWHNNDVYGQGVTIFCPACRTATLIQFYRYGASGDDGAVEKILASFGDHCEDDRIFWSIFDIRAVIPAGYKLEHYRFDAGRFLLAFAKKNGTINLYRWGPAAALLEGGDLLQFARDMQIVPETAELSAAGDTRVEGTVVLPSGKWAAVFNRLRPGRSVQVFRCWHLKGKNRILGVCMTGKQTVDAELFKSICTAYESL